jgi:hypothetical protein
MLQTMTQSPTMEPRELKDHSGWYVRVTWSSGHFEDVDVAGEAEARDWINRKSAAWLAGRVQKK